MCQSVVVLDDWVLPSVVNKGDKVANSAFHPPYLRAIFLGLSLSIEDFMVFLSSDHVMHWIELILKG